MALRILLLGSGGREHAMAWKITQSPLCAKLFIAPGNAGTSQCGENLSFNATDFNSIKTFCISEKIDMVVVGPEEPLVKGIYDFFKADPELTHISVIGPSAKAALLEGSKSFAKSFMIKHGIPTAGYKEFNEESFQEGIDYLKAHPLPIVIKADGLAAGKGVIICQSHLEAISEFELMIQKSKFGEAGKKVVVEEFLTGIELSVFVLTDGKSYVLLPEAKDYKRVGEGDKGLNTGGMGAVSPVPFADAHFMEKVRTRIIEPTINGIAADGLEYKGFVFIGLISVLGEPYVIEYNCRMGDPETEVVMPRLSTDLVELLQAVAENRVGEKQVIFDSRAAATVMAVSGGYPGHYEKGFEISGLDILHEESSFVFHAGTKEQDGKIVTDGGRVFAVTSYGKNINEASNKSIVCMDLLHFEDIYFRRDIGFEFK
ncbi:MAG: phosphoribosylamine--glycine ligase [Chitinophagaceae bacterium]